MKFTKRTLIGSTLGAVFASGAAFAAVTLWASGHAAAAAVTPQGITIDTVSLTPSLVPGGTSGVVGVAHNENDFSVQITDLVIWDAGQSFTPAACVPASVTVGGTAGTFLKDASTSAAGKKIALTAPVTIAPHAAANISAPAAISQAGSATAFCGFTFDLGAVVTSAGN